MKRITQSKTKEEVQEYFEERDKKLWEEHGFVEGEMSKVWGYCRERQELLEKCGNRLIKIKTRARGKTGSVQITNKKGDLE